MLSTMPTTAITPPTTSYPCGVPPGLPNAGGTFWSSTLYEYQCNSGFRMTGRAAQITCYSTGQWSSAGISCVPLDTRRTIHNEIHVQGVPSWVWGLLCGLVGLIALACIVFTVAYLCGHREPDSMVRSSGGRRSRRWADNEISDVETSKQSSGSYVTSQSGKKLWMPHSRPARDNNVVII